MLLSANGIEPFHFLRKEDVGHAFRRHLVVRRGGLFARDHGQPRFFVPGDYRCRGLGLSRGRNSLTFA